jgi:pyruvate dehydrogenase E1 component beta subunit
VQLVPDPVQPHRPDAPVEPERQRHLVVAQEAAGFVSVGSEIAATIAERAYYRLEAPVLRVSGFDTPFPPAAVETYFLPSPDRILEAVDRALAY